MYAFLKSLYFRKTVKSFKCTQNAELKRFRKPDFRARRFDILANGDRRFRRRSEIQDAGRGKEQDEHDDRYDVLDHDPVEALEAELAAAVLDFFDDPVRTDHPADQDRGQHGDEGHHETVADIVHQIQELADAAVGQRELHIELAISQRDDDRSDGVEQRQRDCSGLSLGVEDFHTIRSNRFQVPKKNTVLAFAVALELDLNETNYLLKKAGYAFSNAILFDVLIQYFIYSKKYDIFEINEILYDYNQPLLGMKTN